MGRQGSEGFGSLGGEREAGEQVGEVGLHVDPGYPSIGGDHRKGKKVYAKSAACGKRPYPSNVAPLEGWCAA